MSEWTHAQIIDRVETLQREMRAFLDRQERYIPESRMRDMEHGMRELAAEVVAARRELRLVREALKTPETRPTWRQWLSWVVSRG